MRGVMKCKHRACCHHYPLVPFRSRPRAMKVQQIAVGGFWEQQLQDPSSPSSSFSFSSSSTSTTSSLTVRFTRLRPLAPKLTATVAATAVATTQTAATSLDSKGFHFPRTKCPAANPDSSQMEKPSGGTRWNPTPEQIRVLEALYRGGTRTPNAHQIECITAELGKYGRIEGKNVFYWFQNHKARERQKQKRSALLALSSSSSSSNNDSRSSNSNNYSSACSPIIPLMTTTSRGGGGGAEECYDGTFKRTCRSWGGIGPDIMEEGGRDRTLELFPLRPEGKHS